MPVDFTRVMKEYYTILAPDIFPTHMELLQKVFLFISAAVAAYLIGGINPAIVLSDRIYHQDIRQMGSGNPGFTNFKRAYGNRWAWFVFVLDIAKTVVVVGLFSMLFGSVLEMRQMGAAYTGFFAMIGHVFPIWYQFEGGKGFLVGQRPFFWWIGEWV